MMDRKGRRRRRSIDAWRAYARRLDGVVEIPYYFSPLACPAGATISRASSIPADYDAKESTDRPERRQFNWRGRPSARRHNAEIYDWRLPDHSIAPGWAVTPDGGQAVSILAQFFAVATS